MHGRGLFVIKEKLKRLKSYLKIWNRDSFGNVNLLGEVLQKKIQDLNARDDEDSLDAAGREERKFLLAEQNRNLIKQEVVFHQKARLKWLKQGNLNTKYFH